MRAGVPTFFHSFQADISEIGKAERFNFPFFYEPDALSRLAAAELQTYLEQQEDFVHNFGLTPMEGTPIGKMFGVLVVATSDGTLGYLAACSGKLAGRNTHTHFVPPVFDMLTKDSFFLQEEETINALNHQIAALESAAVLPTSKIELEQLTIESEVVLKRSREAMKVAKANRKQTREQALGTISDEAYALLIEDLIKQSYRDQHEHAVLKETWKSRLCELQTKIENLQAEIDTLKQQRKDKSAKLQARLFDEYQFLNGYGTNKSLLQIFKEAGNIIPPAGAGECAAPKLLQYAFAHQLQPISIAEFWWGSSPASAVRTHKSFYPACKSKCEPILTHMLEGIDVDPNPLLDNPALDKELPILYEDEAIIVVNKPNEFLSVPGIHIQDSVYTRVLARNPGIEGPVIIHRLDMSTSGILVLAKTKFAHHYIQQQFIKHTIEKRYTALLDGRVTNPIGEIKLPLRVDLDDRPRQLVCYEYGKEAHTSYRVVGVEQHKTRIHFFPHTGRTHQLRVHAAHSLGLNCPILGDDLYGKRADRLHLHAGYIKFVHPLTHKEVTFSVPDPF